MRKIIQPCGFHCIKINNLGVSFGEQTVLEDVNMHIHCGSFNVIIGQNGAGKSTLIKAILGEIPHTGTIEFKDTKDGHMAKLKIGYVPQKGVLLSGTIASNLRYGNQEATDEEVYAAARAVSADRVAAKLEQGYDTDVGECGDKLSTGEKQLISFARAVIARPKIFVLDEATSSVDTETEMLIQKATHTLMQGTTSFVIAHRLSTIRQADVILVIDHGKIVEQGTHERLLKAGGAYAALYHTQLSRQE